ncbi:hypothetical protein CBR_g40868 [Chara braunii]|uniref:Dof-type domain-containing protein n=1 Tax=Chara braunii TaxID=69332 RepID=A0A388K297_CHABU|nr:hypothetical protein CBR_g40868 [Chara braunii]|eukprot:GBG64168.1 hypothetical protein CBR_g40868 [Chara braunii]
MEAEVKSPGSGDQQGGQQQNSDPGIKLFGRMIAVNFYNRSDIDYYSQEGGRGGGGVSGGQSTAAVADCRAVSEEETPEAAQATEAAVGAGVGTATIEQGMEDGRVSGGDAGMTTAPCSLTMSFARARAQGAGYNMVPSGGGGGGGCGGMGWGCGGGGGSAEKVAVGKGQPEGCGELHDEERRPNDRSFDRDRRMGSGVLPSEEAGSSSGSNSGSDDGNFEAGNGTQSMAPGGVTVMSGGHAIEGRGENIPTTSMGQGRGEEMTVNGLGLDSSGGKGCGRSEGLTGSTGMRMVGMDGEGEEGGSEKVDGGISSGGGLCTSQEKTKRPDKAVACPRCESFDTKFCYYNNYNVNQPRHFCKGCQRYWTAGGTLRNVPVGAGRRKNKHSQQKSANGQANVSSGGNPARNSCGTASAGIGSVSGTVPGPGSSSGFPNSSVPGCVRLEVEDEVSPSGMTSELGRADGAPTRFPAGTNCGVARPIPTSALPAGLGIMGLGRGLVAEETTSLQYGVFQQLQGLTAPPVLPGGAVEGFGVPGLGIPGSGVEGLLGPDVRRKKQKTRRLQQGVTPTGLATPVSETLGSNEEEESAAVARGFCAVRETTDASTCTSSMANTSVCMSSVSSLNADGERMNDLTGPSMMPSQVGVQGSSVWGPPPPPSVGLVRGPGGMQVDSLGVSMGMFKTPGMEAGELASAAASAGAGVWPSVTPTAAAMHASPGTWGPASTGSPYGYFSGAWPFGYHLGWNGHHGGAMAGAGPAASGAAGWASTGLWPGGWAGLSPSSPWGAAAGWGSLWGMPWANAAAAAAVANASAGVSPASVLGKHMRDGGAAVMMGKQTVDDANCLVGPSVGNPPAGMLSPTGQFKPKGLHEATEGRNRGVGEDGGSEEGVMEGGGDMGGMVWAPKLLRTGDGVHGDGRIGGWSAGKGLSGPTSGLGSMFRAFNGGMPKAPRFENSSSPVSFEKRLFSPDQNARLANPASIPRSMAFQESN